ncbi:MAG: 6-carboxytetrahydropterin synthase [Lachnospiraceae bacterium]|nr:6-carboxytetrahydropterin synthase [Lachnospiraceae bacterium]
MYTLKSAAYFDSAHFLSGYHGKCENLHGHRWKVEAEIYSEKLIEQGDMRSMVVDFADFKRDLKAEVEPFDHVFIYEQGSLMDTTVSALEAEGFSLLPVPFRPTAEEFAKFFFDRMAAHGYQVKCVIVAETPNNIAGYSA